MQEVINQLKEAISDERDKQKFKYMTDAGKEYHMGKQTGLEYALDVLMLHLYKENILDISYENGEFKCQN